MPNSVNEVLGTYASAGKWNCSVVIADWLACVADVSRLILDGDVFVAVEFWRLFFFSQLSFELLFRITNRRLSCS